MDSTYGQLDAQNNLGVRYNNGEGVEQDYERAMEYYELAADQGHAKAQNNLGSCYFYGNGVEQDYEKARREGLLAGVDESCGFLIKAGNADVQSQKYRVREEPALHKILDLLGDLAFVRPALPKIRVEILNGGHAAHRQIIEKVINYAIRF
jgi:UDP-3-O-acyl-N-acetylglucosamine deacetylase